MFSLKHRTAVEVVDTLASASVNSQVAFESCAESSRLLNTLSTVWALHTDSKTKCYTLPKRPMNRATTITRCV